MTRDPARQLTPAHQERLARRRIFFGHQSVGGNVLDGVSRLVVGGTPVRLRVERTLAVDGSMTGVLAHEWLGENGDPRSKLDAFVAALEGPAMGAEIGLFKLCYTDFGPSTSVERVFSEYVASVGRLRASRPDLILVHVTTPVTEPDRPLQRLLRTVRGRQTARDRLAMIENYNQLLRREFAGREPVFDLARLESGGPGGSPATVAAGGVEVPALHPAFSEDGAHLNSVGREAIGLALLHFLSDSITAPSP